MNSIFKKLLLVWTLFFTSFLYADGVVTTINISNATSVNEADAGSTKMKFTVTLSDTPFLFTKVHYTTSNGSATAGSDYVAKSGDLWFWTGQSSKTIEIEILDDNIDENNEYLYINVSTTATGYEVADGRGYGYIIDNEATPMEVRADNQTIAEPDAGTKSMNFKIYLNQPAPAGGVTANDATSDDTAVKNDDYIETTGSVTIPEGSSSVYVPVPIVGDLLPEAQEQFYLHLTSTNVGTLKSRRVIGYIYDSDAIRVDISSSDVQEGNSGDSNKMAFRIFLTKPYPLTTPLTISYQTQDGSAPSATAGYDYHAKSGSVTFNQGDTEKIVEVDIIGDEDIEPDENLKMIISGSRYIIDNSSESEILNDDGSYPGVNFTTTPFSITEGDVGKKNLEFTFTLDKPALAGTSFKYYTQDDEAKISDNDYDEVPLTTYTVPEGETQISIVVKINGDTTIEPDETFYLKIQDEVNINVTGHTAEGIILNDDGSYPSLTFEHNSYSISEGNIGQKDLNFTMLLDQPALEGSSFDYTTQDNTAQTSDNDYVAIPTTTYNIPKDATEITIPVKINGDTNIESDESFYLKITNEVNLTFSGTQQTTATILNDDGDYPEISFDKKKYKILEGDSGEKDLNITLTLDAPALADTQINYYTKDKTAQDGSNSSKDSDYVATAGTLVIPTGSTTASVIVKINGDTNIEPNEKFYFYIKKPINVTIKSNRVKAIIQNDDVHNEEPFTCDNHMYLSSSIKRGSKKTGKMWLHRIDTNKNPFGFEVMDDAGEPKLYNALAYSSQDNYIYGLYKKELIKLSKTGKVISLGDVLDLPAILTTKQLFAGAIYNGEYYISGPGVDYDKIYKIDLLDKNVSEITLNTAISILDFSFTPDGHYLHGIVDGGKLVKINVDMNSTDLGKVDFIGEAHTGYQFDSSFSDKNGRFFANDSKGNGFFEFDLTTGAKQFLSDSQPADFNDGANCLKAALVFTDYGDAPSSYGNPKHNIANGVFLGDEVDHDIKPYHSVNADGDDLNGIDDEDGVTLVDGSDLNGSYFAPNQTYHLKVKVAKEGYLNMWIDYGTDGVFGGSDKVITAGLLTTGEHDITFHVPNDVDTSKTSYMRFRFSSTPNLDATQNASDGEVEDYAIKFGTPFRGVRGDFNIQRTNSALNAKDFNLYTQIVGRDFNYHIVFYKEDFSVEKALSDVPVKIDLINAQTSEVLHTDYAYFSSTLPSTRVPMLENHDLDTLPATKEALFLITYATNSDGTVKQEPCTSATAKGCFETLMSIADGNKTVEAQDTFAIRPERFYVSLKDKTVEKVNSDYPTPSINLASGYEYNLTIMATEYKKQSASKGYNSSFTESFDFNMSGLTSCRNTSAIKETITFLDGLYNNASFTHNEVGQYNLTLHKDSHWTMVDQSNHDCLANSSATSTDANTKSGCDIALAIAPIKLNFYPDHFNVNLTMQNLPNSTHDDFIYMSELNATYDEVAIGFDGKITAQNEQNATTENFTAGCMATNLLLDLNASSVSVEGNNSQIHSINGTDINFTRYVQFNQNTPNATNELNKNLTRIANTLNINKDKFLNENNGTLTLDMRYNLNKHPSEPMNPVGVTFTDMKVADINTPLVAYSIDNHLARGEETFTHNIKNFYFARVVSDLNNYPKVNMHVSPLVRTPLNVDFYCATTITNYCKDRDVFANTNLAGTTREQNGWYLSVKHNANLDGNVTELRDNPSIVTITPDPTATKVDNDDISLTHGENGLITARFNSCSPNTSSTVTIVTDPALAFEPSEYTVNCTNIDPSQWTGIGQTGNVLRATPKVNKTGKMDW